jgi:hypothetical protein
LVLIGALSCIASREEIVIPATKRATKRSTGLRACLAGKRSAERLGVLRPGAMVNVARRRAAGLVAHVRLQRVLVEHLGSRGAECMA